jgi:hypothetical protein
MARVLLVEDEVAVPEHLDRLGYTKVFDYKAGKPIGNKRAYRPKPAEQSLLLLAVATRSTFTEWRGG